MLTDFTYFTMLSLSPEGGDRSLQQAQTCRGFRKNWLFCPLFTTRAFLRSALESHGGGTSCRWVTFCTDWISLIPFSSLTFKHSSVITEGFLSGWFFFLKVWQLLNRLSLTFVHSCRGGHAQVNRYKEKSGTLLEKENEDQVVLWVYPECGE